MRYENHLCCLRDKSMQETYLILSSISFFYKTPMAVNQKLHWLPLATTYTKLVN